MKLLILFLIITIISKTNAQVRIVTGHAEIVPNNLPTYKKITLKNIATGYKRWYLTDTSGNYTMILPSGTYEMKTEAENTYIHYDTLNISADTTAGSQTIENITIYRVNWDTTFLEKY